MSVDMSVIHQQVLFRKWHQLTWHQASYSVDQRILHFGMTGSISYHTLSVPTVLNFKYSTTQYSAYIHTLTVFLLPVTVRTYQTVLFKAHRIVQRSAHLLKTHTIVSESLLDTSCWKLYRNFLELLKIILFHSLHLLFGLSKQVFQPLSAVLPEKSKDTILQIMSQRLA